MSSGVSAEPAAQAREEAWAACVLDAAGVAGGLVVHVGCGDGKRTAALGSDRRYLVHGLDPDPENVRRARQWLQQRGLYGRVSVDRFDPGRLPYAENLVNLLVISDPYRVDQREIRRVLCPGGVALQVGAGAARPIAARLAKPWPAEIDQWTHWLHAADGNPVARDRVVGPPRRLQWLARPLWQRHHDTVPSTTAMVSANGRLFYISDEAPPCLDGSLPDRWYLVARDAFNGVLLWKRPISHWGWNQWCADWLGRFNCPPQLPKRLVAAGDRVYATLDFNAPLSELDAATGEVLRVFKGTEYTDEILYHDGLLVLSVNHEARAPTKEGKTPIRKSVCALDADSGKMLWKTGDYVGLRAKYNSTEPFGRLELAAGGDRAFLADADALLSLDLRSGRQCWRIPRPAFEEHLVMYNIRMSDQCVLLYQDGVVLFAQPEMKKRRSWHTLPGTLHAYRAEDGKELWQHPYGGWAHNWQPDVFVIDGLVWVHEHQAVPFGGHDPPHKDQIDYAVIGIDLKTGTVARRFSTRKAFDVGHHHRCYRGKATERFLIASRRGAEFLDLATEANDLNHWARGACLHGFVPCNGLLYLSPHPCECYIATKLNGYVALAPAETSPESASRAERSASGTIEAPGREAADRLERGPAFGFAGSRHPEADRPTDVDWPTFRHDRLRSGATTSTIDAEVSLGWSAAVGGRPSPPVVAGGNVFVAAIDQHRVTALDAVSGKLVWQYTTGARVDTPPTIAGGMAIFGSADGWVYCLRASDGELVWRRCVAPQTRLIGAFGQLESAWPVSGSVLVQDGVIYLAAGRSSYVDGGIFLYALEASTGAIVQQRVLYSPVPETGAMPPGDARTIPGALTDVLVSDGTSIFMRQQKVFGDESTAGIPLFSTAGFRDDTWFNRTCWTLDSAIRAQLLVFDDDLACGVAAYPNGRNAHSFQPVEKGYLLFTQQRRAASSDRRSVTGSPGSKNRKGNARRWSVRVPIRITAMVLAGGKLLAAGTPAAGGPRDPLGGLEGRNGGRMWIVSASDGSKLADAELDRPPVYDGMAVADGRLYVSMAGGELQCWTQRRD